MGEEDQRLDIPRGLSNPWKFVQKRIIFENKIEMVDAVKKYHKVYARDKENDALLQDAIVSMRQLFLEIKEIVKKNKKAKREGVETIQFMEAMLTDPKKDYSSEDFPELYKHYVKLMDLLVYIGLTDIETKNEDPGEAVSSTDA